MLLFCECFFWTLGLLKNLTWLFSFDYCCCCWICYCCCSGLRIISSWIMLEALFWLRSSVSITRCKERWFDSSLKHTCVLSETAWIVLFWKNADGTALFWVVVGFYGRTKNDDVKLLSIRLRWSSFFWGSFRFDICLFKGRLMSSANVIGSTRRSYDRLHLKSGDCSNSSI